MPKKEATVKLQAKFTVKTGKKPFSCASSKVFIPMMHTSKPAQGKVMGSCQFHGVWTMLTAIRFFFLLQKLAAMVLPATSPGPWVTSPSQHINTIVERFHLTTEKGLPSLPTSFWADLKVCIPGLENLSYPKSRLKPAAVFQSLPSKPAIHAHSRARACSRTSFDTKKSLELFSCSPKHKANFTYSAFKLYLFVPSTYVLT